MQAVSDPIQGYGRKHCKGLAGHTARVKPKCSVSALSASSMTLRLVNHRAIPPLALPEGVCLVFLNKMLHSQG